MRHAYESDASATAPPLSEANDPGFPTDGDTAAGVQPTEIGTYWAHAVSSEVINVITEASLTPGNALNQLATAVTTLITAAINAIVVPGGVTFATRNQHIQANPPGNRAANPADSRFAIRSYLAARA